MARFPVGKILKADGDTVDATDFSAATYRPDPERLISGVPHVEFVWRHRAPRGKVIVLSSPGGVGKSSLLAGLAVARALGHDMFLGAAIKPGATLFVIGEDDRIDVERRIAAWIDHLCKGNQTAEIAWNVAKQISIVELTGTDARLVIRTKRDFEADLCNAEGIAVRVRSLDPRPDLIVIDTVARFGGDESNQAHGALITATETIAKGTGAGIILVSHTGKMNARESTFDAYSARGGSALADSARGSIVFGKMPGDQKLQRSLLGRTATPEEKKAFILVFSRSSFAPPQDPVVLRALSVCDSVVFEQIDAASPLVVAADRERHDVLLVNAVRTIIQNGKMATVRELRRQSHLLTGISFRGLVDAIEDAVEDGALAYGDKGKRGAIPLILGPNANMPRLPPEIVKAAKDSNGGELSEWLGIVSIDFGEGPPADGWMELSYALPDQARRLARSSRHDEIGHR